MQTLTIFWQFSSNAGDGDSVCILAWSLSLSSGPTPLSMATSRECHVRGCEPVPVELCDHRARTSNARPSALCSLCLTVFKIVRSTPKACPTSSHFAAIVGTMSLRMSNRDGLAPTKYTRQTNRPCKGYTTCPISLAHMWKQNDQWQHTGGIHSACNYYQHMASMHYAEIWTAVLVQGAWRKLL